MSEVSDKLDSTLILNHKVRLPIGRMSPWSEPEKVKYTYTQTPIINVAEADLRNNRVISGSLNKIATTQYKMLRMQLMWRLTKENWNTVGITSVGEEEGKTLTAINLAISLAKEKIHSVLLVDLDLHNPSIARYFNHQPRYGLMDLLQGGIEFSDVLFNPGVDNLVILPSVEPAEYSTEVLSSQKMERLIQEIKQRYSSRIVIFDLPSISTTNDTEVISPLIESMLFVVEEHKTNKKDIKLAMGRLKKTTVLGAVINKCQGKPVKYYNHEKQL